MAKKTPADVAWTVLLVLAYLVAAGLLVWALVLTLG
jgi:hypothetical protein